MYLHVSCLHRALKHNHGTSLLVTGAHINPLHLLKFITVILLVAEKGTSFSLKRGKMCDIIFATFGGSTLTKTKHIDIYIWGCYDLTEYCNIYDSRAVRGYNY